MRLLLFILLTFTLILSSKEGHTLKTDPDDLFVTQIAIDPSDSKTLYTLTTYSIGVLKSTDQGKRWTQINQGIRSYSLYQLTVHPKDPNILYLGAGGAGLYKSTDRGATWVEMNDGLQNTDIGMLTFHPDDPEGIYIVTSTGLFKSPNGGKSWITLNQGDNFTSSQQFQSVVVLPTSPPTFYLASGKGLYTRREGDAGWVSAGEPFTGKRISALTRDPQTGKLYAAVFRRGTTETLHEGGLFVSNDQGKNWSRLGEGFEQDWIRLILVDPVNFQILYLTTSGRGILKSTDGGKHWTEINVGLTDPNRDVRTLVIDPHDPKILYAGSHGYWVYQSRDAGATWRPLPIGPHQTAEQIIAAMNREDEIARRNSQIHPPPSFSKCNQCHGWTDPSINRSRGSWRVAANRRDWAPTVKRMSKGAGLAPSEETQIAEFLNTYTQRNRSVSSEESKGSQNEEIQVSVLGGKEEEDPVVAWDEKNYLVLWQTNRKDPLNYDVYGTRVRPDGEVLNPQGFPVSAAPSNQLFIDIAWGKGVHLAVWQDLRSRQRWEIYGARIRSDGTVLDPDGIPIAVGERNTKHPQVAWDGENFLVVWTEENTGTGWDVAGARVSPEGKVLDSERIRITQAPGDQTNPSLAWGKDQYLVVWMDRRPNAGLRINGTRVTSSGKVLDPDSLVLSSSSSRDPGYPTAAWGKEQFVVIWADQRAPALHTLSGIRVGSAGEILDPGEFAVASSSNLHTFPSIRCTVKDCLVVWEEDRSEGRPMGGIEDVIRDVRGAFLDLSKQTVTPEEIMIAPQAVGNHFAKVASDGRNYLVVWKDYRTGTAASLGRLVAASLNPLLINRIAIDPKNPRIVYAATRPQGVLKSTDRGKSWRPAREGIRNTSVYHIVMNPANPKILYLGTFGGGIYKTENGGERWFEANEGLGNTNIHALIINPLQPNQLVASTSTGELFKTENGGKNWTAFNEGLPSFPGEIISTLLIFPKEPAGLYLSQGEGGLFIRPFSSAQWRSASQSLKGEAITTLAYDPRDRILYAGTMKAGLFKTNLGDNSMSAQFRLDWTPVGEAFQKQWIRLIASDPSNSAVLYVSVVGQGIFKSTDRGTSWGQINTGLAEKEVESLAVDPQDPQLLYAGTHNHGLFVSRDGGKTWNPPPDLEVEPIEQIIASLSSQPPSIQSKEPRILPPLSFSKCNQCHGWTDPLLNEKSTFWRVPPNRRDWKPTVRRMSRGAGLTNDEEDEIIRFLDAYSKQRKDAP